MSKIHKPWVSHEELDAFLGGGVLDVLPHAADHEVGGGDLLAFASITDFGTYLDQAVKQASAVSFTGITDTATTATNLAAGTTGQRPGGIVGDMRYNSTLGAFEVYTGAWGSLKLTGSAPTAHAASHEVGGGDLLDLAKIVGATVKLTDLTDGYIPYHVSDALGLADSPIFIDGIDVGMGTAAPGYNLHIVDVAGHAAFKVETTNDGSNAYFHLSVDAGTWTIYHSDADSKLYFYYGATRMVLQSDGNVGINVADPDEKLEVNGNIKATTFLGNLHWDYITNEPTYYPPEFHWHIGNEIKSDHLVDIDYDPDVHGDDKVFDVLATGAINGLGNYDWFGTWTVTAGAGCTAEVEVLAGDDKMLTLTDGNNLTRVVVELNTVADHPMVSSVIQFDIRQSTNTDESVFYLRNSGGAQLIGFEMADDGNIKYYDGAVTTNLCAYVANTWYTIRAHIDCVSGYSIIWVDNIWNCRKALTAMDYINNLYIRTKVGDTGYTLNINNLKIFNLTV